MEYKITFKNHLSSLQSIQWSIIILSIAMYIFWDSEDYEGYIGLITIFGILFLIDLIPTLWLHIEYFGLNKKIFFVNNEIQKQLIINKVTIPYYQIKSIKYVMPHHWYGMQPMRYFSAFEYHYAKLTTVDGDVFYITSLLCGDVQKALSSLNNQPHIQIEKYKWMFCSPWWFEKDEIQ